MFKVELNYLKKVSINQHTKSVSSSLSSLFLLFHLCLIFATASFTSFKSCCSFGMFCQRKNLSSYVEPKTHLCRIHEWNFSNAQLLLQSGVCIGHPLLHRQHTKHGLFDWQGQPFSLMATSGSLCFLPPLQRLYLLFIWTFLLEVQ